MCQSSASAASGGLLCERREERAAVVIAGPARQLGAGELPLGLRNGPLAVHPPGLDRVQPRAPARQATDQQAAAAARLTRRLWATIQARTSRLTCQAALSQTKARTRAPSAASCPTAQAGKAQVTPLTGRPPTNRSSMRSRSGSHRP